VRGKKENAITNTRHFIVTAFEQKSFSMTIRRSSVIKATAVDFLTAFRYGMNTSQLYEHGRSIGYVLSSPDLLRAGQKL